MLAVTLRALGGARPGLGTIIASVAALAVLVVLDGAQAKVVREPSPRAPDLSRAKVLWTGGFESGDFSEWNLQPQQKQKGRASVVTDVEGAPPRQGRYALRVEVRPGDNNVAGSGSGERTELLIGAGLTDGQEGRESYWAWSTYFPANFTAPAGTWNAFTQFHQTGPTGQANIQFDVRDLKTIGLRVMGGDFGAPTLKSFALAPLQRGHWYDFLFHVKWSPDGRVGFVEVFVDGFQIVPKTFTPTLYRGQGAYLKMGYYRSAYGQTSVVYADAVRRIQPQG